MPRSPRAPALLLGLLALAACDRPAPTLPVGRIVGGLPLGDHESAIVLSDLGGEAPVIAVVDEKGAPRWVKPLAPAEFPDLYTAPDLAISPDLVLLTGAGLHAFERTTGALRWRLLGERGERPGGALVQDGLLLYPGLERLDALDPATGQTTWSVESPERVYLQYLSDAHVARITSIYRTVHPDGRESPDPGYREHVDVVHGPTGAVVWSADLVEHCRVDHTLLGITRDRGLVAVDLASDPPAARTVVTEPRFNFARHAELLGCTRRGDAWWLHHRLYGDASALHGVDRTTGAVQQVGLCNVVSATGRVAVTRGHGDQSELRGYDLDRGKLTWGQNLAIHKPRYTRAIPAGDLVFLTGDPDHEPIQHVLAYDPNADEITGAVALRGARRFDPGETGDHWVYSDGYTPRGSVPLVVLGRRDLRPQRPAPAGLDVVDTLAEARAGQQDPEATLVFDPTWDPARHDLTLEGGDSPCYRGRRY